MASLGKIDKGAIWWPFNGSLIKVPSGGQLGQISTGCHLVGSYGKIEMGVRWLSVSANWIGIPSNGHFHSNTRSIIWVYHVVYNLKHCQCRVVVPNFT